MLNILKGKTAEEKQAKAAAKTVESVLSDPKAIKIATDTAVEIERKLKNWFTIDQLMSKTSFRNLEPALDVINLLCMAGLCIRLEKSPGIIKHKITLSAEVRLQVLLDERKEAEERVAYLTDLINKLRLS